MIKPEQVPDAVLNAAAKSIPEVDMEDYSQYWSETLRVAIAAALNAWPGMLTERRARCDAVVLPYNLDADLERKQK